MVSNEPDRAEITRILEALGRGEKQAGGGLINFSLRQRPQNSESTVRTAKRDPIA